MNVGILTLPFNTNYGGIMQGYALQTVLERLGHDVWHINNESHHSLPMILRPIAYAKRLVEQKVQGKNKRIFFEEYQNAIAENTNEFIRKHINLWKDGRIESVEENDFNAIVVGSDQIWRHGFLSNIENAYLDFTLGWNIKRIAYAASFGLDTWQYDRKETEKCAKLLACFDKVSVRETSAVRLCKQYLMRDVACVADPTLLLHKEEYMQLIDMETMCEGDMFVYLLGNNDSNEKIVNEIARQKGLTPFEIISDDDIRKTVRECVRPPVEKWIEGFAKAKLVVTNSFHGCVFSIIFGKPFVLIEKRDAGVARLYSLLEQLGMDMSILDENSKALDGLTINNPATQAVSENLMLLRKEGMEFLRSSLNE
ncbi:MAG: polysaccharide pyruvyl transferase family protein [Prevotella sp.]|nr:polysaccharide pyruvyl transferase family protein [Prevotella sp.]